MSTSSKGYVCSSLPARYVAPVACITSMEPE